MSKIDDAIENLTMQCTDLYAKNNRLRADLENGAYKGAEPVAQVIISTMRAYADSLSLLIVKLQEVGDKEEDGKDE